MDIPKLVRLFNRTYSIPLQDRKMGRLLRTTNYVSYMTTPYPAALWTTWGQTDIYPFTDDHTTFGELP